MNIWSKMGCKSSKPEKNEALHLCKERRKFIKQAIDSRYALAAAHTSYIQCLRNIGIALRRYAEAEVLIESSLSTSATELDKTPSHSSYPSPSPTHIAEAISDSPLHTDSPISPVPLANVSYMRSGGGNVMTVKVSPSISSYVEDDSMAFSMPPPPPPPESCTWDFFDPSDDSESFRFVGHSGTDDSFYDMSGWRQFKREQAEHSALEARGKTPNHGLDKSNEVNKKFVRLDSEHKGYENSSPRQVHDCEMQQLNTELNANGLVETSMDKVSLQQSSSKIDTTMVNKDLCAEREDPSEFITHRAKDFLSSIKDIEHRFFRASESGKEVSRMLEANKIRVGYSEAKGKSSSLAFLVAFKLVCCQGKNGLVSHEPSNHVTKAITWKRTTSSRSSSSKNPLATSKDDGDDSGSDFIEEFSMIAGSHSSTLDRLYAWERKLHDEVKASESIRKVYDRKCEQLRHQFAKDCSSHVIDKTRSVVKDLHSRIRVAIHSIDTISKRIEKMRDEELQPQLIELIQGLIRMWKAMLECHHAQYITISLAYHSRSSLGISRGDAHRQIMTQLQNEIEYFGLSFADWINSHASYIEELNGWLQNCILQPQERTKNKRPFSPRKVLAPPLFVLCRDWSAGIKSLPSNELGDAIKNFLSDLHESMVHREELHNNQKQKQVNDNGELESKDEKNTDASSNLCSIHTSLTKVLDQMNKFSEASLKMYEDIRQKSEAARVAYSNGRPTRF